MCCVKVDPKNSNIIWLGTGENSNPRSSMIGDGVYKSTDGGTTWTRVGLAELRAPRQHADRPAQLERRLRRVAGAAVVRRRRPRPLQDDRRRQDVDRARRAARSARTPAPTKSIFDPANPDVLYVAMWQRRRATGSSSAAGRRAASTSRRTPARRGRSSPTACRRATWAASTSRRRRPRQADARLRDGRRARGRARLLPVG